MPRFDIKINSSGPIFAKTGVGERALRVPMFSTADMEHIGVAAIDTMKKRLASGIDVLDEPAKPLSPRYAQRKQKKGLQPIRDIKYTGITQRSIQITEVDDHHVRVAVTGAVQFKKGIINQNVDPWFGLSHTDDQHMLEEVIKPLFAQNIADALK